MVTKKPKKSKKERVKDNTQRVQDSIQKLIEKVNARDLVLSTTFVGLTMAYKGGLDLLNKAFKGVGFDLQGLTMEDLITLGIAGPGGLAIKTAIEDSVSNEGVAARIFRGITRERVEQVKYQWLNKNNENLYNLKRNQETNLYTARKQYSRLVEWGETQRFTTEGRANYDRDVQNAGDRVIRFEKAITDIENQIREGPVLTEDLRNRIWKQLEVEDWLICMGMAGGTIFLLQEYSVSELIEAIPFIE